MSAQSQQSGNQKLPNEFFDDSSFKTLYGGVVVTWVTTSAIADVWGSLDPKMLGFIVAIIVAFVGYFVTEKHSMKKLIITPFNGLLIYLTIMGGTSFLPAPNTLDVPNEPPTRTEETVDAEPGEAEPVQKSSAFLTSWNPNRDLIQQTTELKQEKQQLELKTQQLQKINTTYETKLDSTRQVIQRIQMSPEVRESLMRSLDVRPNLNNNLMDTNFDNN